MDPIKYRDLDFDDPTELSWAAKTYCDTPRYWDPGWDSEGQAEKVLSGIKQTRADPSWLFLIAESVTGERVGLHRLKVEKVEPGSTRYVGFRINRQESMCAYITALWVHDDYWGQGIATELKRRGESWAREKGATRIESSVHYKNKRMFELNLRSGFEAGNIAMSKNL